MSKQQSSFQLNDLRENAHVEQHNGILDQLDLPPGVIEFLQKNQRKIWTVVTIVAVVIIVTAFYDSYRTYSSNKAAKAYDAALLLEGEQRATALNKVNEDFSSTPSAAWSQIQLAHLDQEAGKNKEAIDRLEILKNESGDEDLLTPLVLANLGALYEQDKQLDKAVAAYEVLQKREGYEALALSSLGRLYESMGKTEQAVATYQRYMSLTEKKQGDAGPAQNSLARDMAQASLNRLLQ
ncbi:MAG: tetratricopeptide repeat protein [Candidatus Electrothrix communis]|nr:tetratricopeptide repeat protein [Desulfobulbus sp. US4]WLE98401.1 MAG: tetratricopeptide repeat protein [Candidatus Electrothrix communis]